MILTVASIAHSIAIGGMFIWAVACFRLFRVPPNEQHRWAPVGSAALVPVALVAIALAIEAR